MYYCRGTETSDWGGNLFQLLLEQSTAISPGFLSKYVMVSKMDAKY